MIEAADQRFEVSDIREAHRFLRENGVAWPTPIIREPRLSRRWNCDLYLKLENFQQTGSYKVRGAYNCMRKILEEERGSSRGFVTASAGNHAQGIGLAAWKLGHAERTHVFMPCNAPEIKLKNTLSYGVVVHLVGTTYQEAKIASQEFEKSPSLFASSEQCVYLPASAGRSLIEEYFQAGVTVHLFGNTPKEAETAGNRVAELEACDLIHAFNDMRVVAGQGTVGLEILEKLPDVDIVLVPVGGGGLYAGISTVVSVLKPAARVVGVQAAETPAMIASLQASKVTVLPKPGVSLHADGINVQEVGHRTFRVAQELIDRSDFVVADQDAVETAIYTLWESMRIEAEGAGAIGLGAFFYRNYDGAIISPAPPYRDKEWLMNIVEGKKVVVVISGGNIDRTRLEDIRSHVLAYRERQKEKKRYPN